MAPIYETDVAKERWNKAEWEHYELWEKVEHRLKKRRKLWIALTLLVGILLFSIPIVADQRPKWKSRSLSRELSLLVQHVRKEAALKHMALSVKFAGEGSLAYRILESAGCGESLPSVLLEEGDLDPDKNYKLLTPDQGKAFEIPGLAESYCYDSQKAPAEINAPPQSAQTTGFAIIPTQDLSTNRSDRISVLLLQGDPAEISFD